jgi:multiple sugar transport system permease protein
MMAAPATVMVGALVLLPLLYSVVLSLYKWKVIDIGRPKEWFGIGNYAQLLHDKALRVAFLNTVYFVLGAVWIELILGFAIALALFNINHGRKLANSIILLPMIITPVVTSLLWRYMLDPQFGIVAQLMIEFGASEGIDVWGSPRLALWGLILVDIWQWTPFVILVFHAGMLAISPEQLEAAAIDGAGHWPRAWNVILPAILPQVLLVVLFRTMDTFRIFDIVFVLTRGGPGDATDTLGLYTYRTGFSHTEMGYAMALSVLVFVVIVMISVFYIRLLRREGVL